MFNYKPHFIPSSVVLVGAGGTGSRLMPSLVQLIRTCIRDFNHTAWIPKLPLYVFDADVVETKNLLRQNFIQPDVGRNKALVVAERYSQAFGIPVIPIPHFLDCSLPNVVQGPEGPLTTSSLFRRSIVILAVDSASARRQILARLSSQPAAPQFVIDAGNEDDFGQIKFFTNDVLMAKDASSISKFQSFINTFPERVLCSEQVDFIPFDYEYYAELGSSAQELSCADLPQTLAINTAMATLILTVVQNFLQIRSMNYDCIRFSMKGSMGAEKNTLRSWSQRVIKHNHAEYVIGPSEYLTYCGPIHLLSDRDPFIRLRNKCEEAYSEAGLILSQDGTVTPKNSPEPKEKPKTARSKNNSPPKLQPIALNIEPIPLRPPQAA